MAITDSFSRVGIGVRYYRNTAAERRLLVTITIGKRQTRMLRTLLTEPEKKIKRFFFIIFKYASRIYRFIVRGRFFGNIFTSRCVRTHFVNNCDVLPYFGILNVCFSGVFRTKPGIKQQRRFEQVRRGGGRSKSESTSIGRNKTQHGEHTAGRVLFFTTYVRQYLFGYDWEPV